MSFFSKCSAAAVALVVASGGNAFADEEMDRILNEAMPHMHHSCESILANYPDDEEAVAEIVRLMVAVSLFNREFDVLKEIPDEAQRETLRVEFIDRLEQVCEADPDTLLAGAVDTATKDAIN
jgi:thioredoxin-like negative regulator of GroEL